MSTDSEIDDELVEWRASSVRMAKMLAAGHQAPYPIKMAEQIWDQIRISCHHPRDSPERGRATRDLETLCNKAFEIALLLRETKIEYEWDQDIEHLPSLATNHKDHEILGTTGPTAGEPHGIHRIVFGGVIRGDRVTGRLKDGRTRLFPTCVVITEQPPLRQVVHNAAMGDSPFSLPVHFQNGIEHSDSQGPAPFSYESRKGLVDIHAQAPLRR